MRGDPKVEYGIFNLLPEGKTIEDIPEPLEWLYTHPFQTDYHKKVLEGRATELNRERKRFFDKGLPYFSVTTYCEVRERDITYSNWRRVIE